jgi:hypothetical protein
MTLVVTHAAGFLACFTRNADGTMKQRALIDTGEEPPTAIELADIGERLSKEYGWNGTTVPVAPVKIMKGKTKALPQKRGYNNSDPPVPERKTLIVAYLRAHPNSTIPEIISGLAFEPDHIRIGRWTHQFNELMRDGIIVSGIRRKAIGSPRELRLP